MNILTNWKTSHENSFQISFNKKRKKSCLKNQWRQTLQRIYLFTALHNLVKILFCLSSLCFPFSRLHSNNLHCDCQLSWLSDWLRARRGLAPFTQCMAPANMRGLNVPDVPKKDFVCNGKVTLTKIFPSFLAHTAY